MSPADIIRVWPDPTVTPTPADGWRAAAPCLGTDPALFTDGPFDEALAICDACPVAADCLIDALLVERHLNSNEIFGVRGGQRPEVRARFFRQYPDRREMRRVMTAVCGTDAGYHAHRRRDEDACAPCKAAHVDAVRSRKQRPPSAPAWGMSKITTDPLALQRSA